VLHEPSPRKFAVTSPEPGDGKTSVVTNLAIAFAQSGLRTLIVEADMRRPRLQELFQLTTQAGLADVLQRAEWIGPYLRGLIARTDVANLDLLPAGTTPDNPTELLGSPTFFKFLAWAETHYERIVFDVPPALAVSDCAILNRGLDGTLLVVRADKSDRRSAERALHSLKNMNCHVLAAVVNGVHHTDTYAYYAGGARGEGRARTPGEADSVAESDALPTSRRMDVI
jgi:capsular exopolysaccharide synthesis family protein